MGNLRQSMTEEEWNEMGIPQNSLLRSINTDGEEDIISQIIDHPNHYGGKENIYEAIKVIEAWDLGFCLGNVVKYLSRAGKKEGNNIINDLKKAHWYLDRHIKTLENGGK